MSNKSDIKTGVRSIFALIFLLGTGIAIVTALVHYVMAIAMMSFLQVFEGFIYTLLGGGLMWITSLLAPPSRKPGHGKVNLDPK